MTAKDFTLYFDVQATDIKLTFELPPRRIQSIQLISLFYPYTGIMGTHGQLCVQARSSTQTVGKLNKNVAIIPSGTWPYLGSCSITLPAASGTFAYPYESTAVAAYNPPLPLLHDLSLDIAFIGPSGIVVPSGLGVTLGSSVVLEIRITADWDD